MNQLTKPDTVDGPTWQYEWETYCLPDELICDPFPDYEDGEQVTDIYTEGGANLTWQLTTPIETDAARVLAHIIPARSAALGQGLEGGTGSVIDSQVEFSYGKHNQGHSAQYYSSFVERRGYWNVLLENFDFRFE